MDQDPITTADLAAHLRRLGLPATEGGIKADLRRGFVGQEMPAATRPGKGHTGLWTRAAVRRARYLGELRRLGVAGRSVPVLAFLFDGWGWERARPIVLHGIARSWAAERRHLNQPLRVRRPEDLDDNVDSGRPETLGPGFDYRGALLPARRFLAQSMWYGSAGANASVLPFAEQLMQSTVAFAPRGDVDIVSVLDMLRQLEDRRRDSPLAASEAPAWIESLSPAAVAQGRQMWWIQLRGLRQLSKRLGHTGSPRLLFASTKDELVRDARKAPDRMTVTDVLAESVVNAMYAASVISEHELPAVLPGPPSIMGPEQARSGT